MIFEEQKDLEEALSKPSFSEDVLPPNQILI